MFHPEPLTSETFHACVSLCETYPFKPYGHHVLHTGEEALCRLFLSRIQAIVKSDASSALWVPGPNHARGLALCTWLAWDSQQLGVGAGRLDYLIASGDYEDEYATKEALLKRVLEDCADQGIRHFTARVHSSNLSSIHLLEQHGFIIVDGILTFSLDLRDAHWATPPEGLEIRLFRPEDIENIKTIARSSYVHDRFHSDPRIPKPVADELHAIWLEHSCRGEAVDAVVVAGEHGRILGFVTCKIDRQTTQYLGLTIGTIVLVATAADVRGQGVAKAITCWALNWFRDRGVDIVEVGTQLRNIPASRLYEACGFRLVASGLSLRKWIDHA